MGKPFMPFFGDQRKAEYEKGIERLNAAIAAESSVEKKAELEAEKADILKALEELN